MPDSIPDCGKRGIRTLGELLAHTRFPIVRLKPLGHLSKLGPKADETQRFTTDRIALRSAEPTGIFEAKRIKAFLWEAVTLNAACL